MKELHLLFMLMLYSGQIFTQSDYWQNSFQDQEQSKSSRTICAWDDNWQSFTAGKSGFLTKVMAYHYSTKQTGVLYFYKGEGITSEELHRQTYTADGTSLLTFDIIAPFLVEEGETYTMRFSNFRWFWKDSDVYKDGRSGGNSTFDHIFKTFVKRPRTSMALDQRLTYTSNTKINLASPTSKSTDKWLSFTPRKTGLLEVVMANHLGDQQNGTLYIYDEEGITKKPLYEQKYSVRGTRLTGIEIRNPILLEHGKKYSLRLSNFNWTPKIRSNPQTGRPERSPIDQNDLFRTYMQEEPERSMTHDDYNKGKLYKSTKEEAWVNKNNQFISMNTSRMREVWMMKNGKRWQSSSPYAEREYLGIGKDLYFNTPFKISDGFLEKLLTGFQDCEKPEYCQHIKEIREKFITIKNKEFILLDDMNAQINKFIKEIPETDYKPSAYSFGTYLFRLLKDSPEFWQDSYLFEKEPFDTWPKLKVDDDVTIDFTDYPNSFSISSLTKHQLRGTYQRKEKMYSIKIEVQPTKSDQAGTTPSWTIDEWRNAFGDQLELTFYGSNGSFKSILLGDVIREVQLKWPDYPNAARLLTGQVKMPNLGRIQRIQIQENSLVKLNKEPKKLMLISVIIQNADDSFSDFLPTDYRRKYFDDWFDVLPRNNEMNSYWIVENNLLPTNYSIDKISIDEIGGFWTDISQTAAFTSHFFSSEPSTLTSGFSLSCKRTYRVNQIENKGNFAPVLGIPNTYSSENFPGVLVLNSSDVVSFKLLEDDKPLRVLTKYVGDIKKSFENELLNPDELERLTFSNISFPSFSVSRRNNLVKHFFDHSDFLEEWNDESKSNIDAIIVNNWVPPSDAYDSDVKIVKEEIESWIEARDNVFRQHDIMVGYFRDLKVDCVTHISNIADAVSLKANVADQEVNVGALIGDMLMRSLRTAIGEMPGGSFGLLTLDLMTMLSDAIPKRSISTYTGGLNGVALAKTQLNTTFENYFNDMVVLTHELRQAALHDFELLSWMDHIKFPEGQRQQNLKNIALKTLDKDVWKRMLLVRGLITGKVVEDTDHGNCTCDEPLSASNILAHSCNTYYIFWVQYPTEYSWTIEVGDIEKHEPLLEEHATELFDLWSRDEVYNWGRDISNSSSTNPAEAQVPIYLVENKSKIAGIEKFFMDGTTSFTFLSFVTKCNSLNSVNRSND